MRLTASAERDFREILQWTVLQFGATQARRYAETLAGAMVELGGGPTVLGVKARDDIASGLFTLHVALNGRRGRHFVMFRLDHTEGKRVVEVLRLLHDAMDLPRHRPPPDDR